MGVVMRAGLFAMYILARTSPARGSSIKFMPKVMAAEVPLDSSPPDSPHPPPPAHESFSLFVSLSLSFSLMAAEVPI